MHPELARFIAQISRAVAATLLPLALLTFLTMPVSLGGHPGEPRDIDPAADRHMT